MARAGSPQLDLLRLRRKGLKSAQVLMVVALFGCSSIPKMPAATIGRIGTMAPALKDDIACFDNPGVFGAIVYDGRDPYGTLTRAAVNMLVDLQNKNRLNIEPDWRVKTAYGPDGKTPIVFPTMVQYLGQETQNVEGEQVLSFPSEALARQSLKYISPAFKTRIWRKQDRWFIAAGHTQPEPSVLDEQEPFIALAKHLDGRFEYSGSTSTH